jgi:hypothetical protein
MIAAGNRINHFPYSYAGGHGAVAQTMNQPTRRLPGRAGKRRSRLRLLLSHRVRPLRQQLRPNPAPGHRARLHHARERRRRRPRQVGHDLRQPQPRLHRGRRHLLRHRRRRSQTPQPTTHRTALDPGRDRPRRLHRPPSDRTMTGCARQAAGSQLSRGRPNRAASRATSSTMTSTALDRLSSHHATSTVGAGRESSHAVPAASRRSEIARL